MLVEKIKKDLIIHIKSEDKLRTSITRLLLAAIKDKEISLGKNQESEETISDNVVLDIIHKMIKQRNLTIKTYIEADRKDLADKEKSEATMLGVYLPTQISDKQLKLLIDKTLSVLEASTIRDMGKVMKFLKDNHTGSFDFQKASELVKENLSKTINLKKI